jgi:hypothetical protein
VALLGAASLGGAPSCSHDGYLKVTLRATEGKFENVNRVVVSVQGGSNMSTAWLNYAPETPISFDTMNWATLSISFTPSQSGTVVLDIGVLDKDGGCLGRGQMNAPIKKGDVTSTTVMVTHTSTCPTADGGTGDGGANDAVGDGVTFPGCDPAAPANLCAANQTCFVNCAANQGICVAAGTKGPGEICAANSDCMPGTQCFDYSKLPGCAAGTKICQKFCDSDAQCASTAGGTGGGAPATGGTGGNNAGGGSGADGIGGAGGAGGAMGSAGGQTAAIGPGTCRNAVVCSPTLSTSYRTCSFGCDPRGNAMAGCPPGLLCFLYSDPMTAGDAPDCGCKEPSRVGTDGAQCKSSAACAPGFICNMMASTQVCRRLCMMTSPGDCPAPTTCSKLSNNSVFGVCIPPGL